MRINIEHKKTETFDLPIDNLNTGDIFLDIDASGLKADLYPVSAISMAYLVSKDTLEITVMQTDERNDEKKLIELFLEKLDSFIRIITFNGEKYDLPFLEHRAEINGIRFDSSLYESLDLYVLAKNCLRNLPLISFSQKSIEECLGISACEASVSRDLFGMIPLFSITCYRQLASCDKKIKRISYDPEDERLAVIIDTDLSVPRAIRFRSSFFYLIVKPKQLRISIMLFDGNLRYYLPNPSDYVYLTDEKVCVPKRLAGSIPKSQKRPAKKEECYSQLKIDPHNPDERIITEYVSRLLIDLMN